MTDVVATPPDDAMIGQIVAGYLLTHIIGRGGTSVIYRGQRATPMQADMPAEAAIKLLIVPAAFSPDEASAFRARFLRTARAAHLLRHPHILPVLRSGEDGRFAYMVMPLVSGGTLASRLADSPRGLPLDQVATFLAQIAGALDYAHHKGVVHRDIKPSNVLLDTNGSTLLTDFGIARLFDIDADAHTIILGQSSMTVTSSGQVIGTPSYMAPEQVRNQTAVPATDVYSLGIVAYQLVTGKLPFYGDTPFAVALQQMQDTPSSPRQSRRDLPAGAEAAILRALAKQPAERFASAEAFARAFAAGLRGDSMAEDPLAASSNHWTHDGARFPEGGLARVAMLFAFAIALLGVGILARHSGHATGGGSYGTARGLTPAATSNLTRTPEPKLPSLPPYSIGNDAVIISWQGSEVFARRQSDNTLLWTYTTEEAIQGVPVLSQGILYIYTPDMVYAVQPTDGTVLGSYQLSGAATPNPTYFPTQAPTPAPAPAPTATPASTPTAAPTSTPPAAPTTTPTSTTTDTPTASPSATATPTQPAP